MIGKDIKKLAQKGTLFDLNPMSAISIIDIIGVDLIITKNRFKYFVKYFIKTEKNPASMPRINEIIKPMRPLFP